MGEFIASTLNSRQLLALLYLCESQRKKTATTPESWRDLLSIFSDRIANLSEEMRFEVLEAHLMSVEDIDIYNNETLSHLLKANSTLLDSLSRELEKDPRFQEI